MNFFYEFTVPKSTKEDDPAELMMPLSYGIITKVQIVVLQGHAGLAHLKVFYHESQLYPLNRDGNYHGDNANIEFEEYQPILVAPYELKAKGWNTDDRYPHSFLCSFTVLRPEELGMEIPLASIRALEELIDEEVEIL